MRKRVQALYSAQAAFEREMKRVPETKASPYVNWWMAASNAGFLYPLWLAYASSRTGFLVLTALAGASSAFYHLHESQKHGLPGGMVCRFTSERWNTVLINIDRVAAVALSAYTLSELAASGTLVAFAARTCVPVLIALGAMTVSETVYRHETHNYALFHTVWHLLAAFVLSVALRM